MSSNTDKYSKSFNIEFNKSINDFTEENNNIIITRKKIKINIFIAIYLYGENTDRYKLTKYIFIHYKNIQEYFKKYADITFTIVGSEKDISKNLVLKYFNEESYIEFDQDLKNFDNCFWKMLGKKINYGINLSSKTNSDIILWAGSNDYICFNFFKQIIEYYDGSKPQIYGLDNYNNGNNGTYYCKYTNDTINDSDTFWHNGEHNYAGRNIYKYMAGIIGINRKVVELYPDILEKWNYDEGYNEKIILDKGNIDKFNSKNLFFMNIKISGSEINSYEILYKYNKNDIIEDKNFSNKFLYIFNNELNYFKKIIENNLKD
jgi:hypothetical protein